MLKLPYYLSDPGYKPRVMGVALRDVMFRLPYDLSDAGYKPTVRGVTFEACDVQNCSVICLALVTSQQLEV